jgi:hypothetical protein
MERISFYLDEHIHRVVANGLRHRELSVLTFQEAEKNGAPDRKQLRFALSEDHVMVTTPASLTIIRNA